MVSQRELFVGLMSGTSADGVDAALVDLTGGGISLVGYHHRPYPSPLRAAVMALFNPGEDGIDQTFSLDVALGRFFAGTVLELLDTTATVPAQVVAIGSHGQTVRHRPSAAFPFSLQLADPNIIAEITGITTVADFRRRDMACGGQGAPLVPAFHHALFAKPGVHRGILNIGGIANLTVLSADGGVTGFDCGPGNGLLDLWCERHTGAPFDADGRWARHGIVDQLLLAEMSSHPYFTQSPPKSTGKEMFSPAWLERIVNARNTDVRDVARTLTELTAWGIAGSLHMLTVRLDELFVCGGGVFNGFLMERITALTGLETTPTSSLGVHPQRVEAMAFAWMASQTLRGLTSNLPAVTGAAGPRILGAIHQR